MSTPIADALMLPSDSLYGPEPTNRVTFEAMNVPEPERSNVP